MRRDVTYLCCQHCHYCGLEHFEPCELLDDCPGTTPGRGIPQ